MAHVTLKSNDRLLLCSDGLHDYFPVEEEIATRMSAEKPGDALKEMVELAKTRGGHDNITGVAVHVVEIVDSIPHPMSDESTQPVDLQGNPFSADEPTQTAFTATGTQVIPPADGSPAKPKTAKQTQPMRVVDDMEGGATLPPPNKQKTVVKGDADAKGDAETPDPDAVPPKTKS
jgi:hypothetical protein